MEYLKSKTGIQSSVTHSEMEVFQEKGEKKNEGMREIKAIHAWRWVNAYGFSGK